MDSIQYIPCEMPRAEGIQEGFLEGAKFELSSAGYKGRRDGLQSPSSGSSEESGRSQSSEHGGR